MSGTGAAPMGLNQEDLEERVLSREVHIQQPAEEEGDDLPVSPHSGNDGPVPWGYSAV